MITPDDTLRGSGCLVKSRHRGEKLLALSHAAWYLPRKEALQQKLGDGVDSEPPPMSPARGPPLWDGVDAPDDVGIEA